MKYLVRTPAVLVEYEYRYRTLAAVQRAPNSTCVVYGKTEPAGREAHPTQRTYTASK